MSLTVGLVFHVFVAVAVVVCGRHSIGPGRPPGPPIYTWIRHWCVTVLELINSNLFIKLCEYVVEFPHHLWVDGITWSNVPEVQQHLEGALSWPERLEGGVYETLGLTLNHRHVRVELFHCYLPLVTVFDRKHVERRLKYKKQEYQRVAVKPGKG